MEKLGFTTPLPTQAGIALGSNLGDSTTLLQQAIKQLQDLHIGPPQSFLLSSLYKTSPVDCPPGTPDFLNAVVQLESSLSPEELLLHLQSMEAKTGRHLPRTKNTPRTLDLDLLYFGTITQMTELLELPHPRICQREFVLRPLAEIAPNILLPGWEESAENYLLKLKNK